MTVKNVYTFQVVSETYVLEPKLYLKYTYFV